MIHKSAFSGLTNKEKHASENGQAQGWDAERVKTNKQPNKKNKQTANIQGKALKDL